MQDFIRSEYSIGRAILESPLLVRWVMRYGTKNEVKSAFMCHPERRAKPEVEPVGRHGVSGSTLSGVEGVFCRSRLRRCFAVRLRYAPLRMTRGDDVLQYYSVSPISVHKRSEGVLLLQDAFRFYLSFLITFFPSSAAPITVAN